MWPLALHNYRCQVEGLLAACCPAIRRAGRGVNGRTQSELGGRPP